MRRSCKEAAALALLLAALSALVYGSHAVHGGFVGDAWASRAGFVFSPHSSYLGTVGYFLKSPVMAARPLNAAYRVALNEAFGAHTALWFAWQAASCVLMSVSLYLLLRKLGLAALDAGPIAALVLVFPAASSLRLWSPVIQASLAIALVTFGFLAALSAFESVGRRRLLLHALSLLLFVTSLLLYEVALPLILASLLLYRLRVPWRPAALRWLLDCAVAIPLALTVSRGPAEIQDASGVLHHAATICEQAVTLLARTVLPLGLDRWFVLGAVALLVAGAAIVAARAPASDPVRAELRRWLVVFAAGLVVVALGYAIYVPGIDYYEPLATGVADRINAVPGIGWVLVLYALIMLASTLAFRGLRRRRLLAIGVATAACALIGLGWTRSTVHEADRFVLAYREGQAVLSAMRTALPKPPPGSRIWTFGQPVEIAPGVPVFGNTWDMNSAAQIMYDDPAVHSFVGFPGTTFSCRPDAIVPNGPLYESTNPHALASFRSTYGSTYFVETTSGRWERLGTPAQCRRASSSFRRSPEFPDE